MFPQLAIKVSISTSVGMKGKDLSSLYLGGAHVSPINNTQIYINLEQAIFSRGDSSEYTSRIAKTVKGARALLEAGFEYVTNMDGFKLFRKRK